MKYEGLTLERQNNIGIITLNRPQKLNALTKVMLEDSLPRAAEEVRKNNDIRVLIITGAGRGFCAGVDLSGLATGEMANHGDERWKLLEPLAASWVLPLHNLEKPIIAAINGVAAGAGVSLILLCDIRIASENSSFALSFVPRGLIPDCGATYSVTRTLGISRALELMLTGDMIDAREAQRIGLVSKVVPPEDLMKTAADLAEKLAKLPPIALGLTKRAAYRGMVNDLEQQLDFETYAQNLCAGTEDHKEAVKAFLEKREAIFRGR